MPAEFQQLLTDLSEDNVWFAWDYHDCQSWKEVLESRQRWIADLQSAECYPVSFERPLGAQLEVTSRCNLRCLFCYNASECRPGPGNELRPDEWMDVARQLVSLGIIECVISGGEPLLLGDDLLRLIDVFAAANVRLILVTNGLLLDRSWAESLASHRGLFAWIQVSIDSPDPAVHDMLRGKSGSWTKAVGAVQHLVDAGLPVGIATTLTRHNVHQVHDMGELALLLGVSRLMIGPFIPSGRGITEAKQLEFSPEDKERIRRDVASIRQTYQGTMVVLAAEDPAIALRMRAVEPNKVVLVRPGGEVRIGCLEPFVIGNVRQTSLSGIWREVGRTSTQRPEFLSYCNSVAKREDLFTACPKHYVDSPIHLQPEPAASAEVHVKGMNGDA